MAKVQFERLTDAQITKALSRRNPTVYERIMQAARHSGIEPNHFAHALALLHNYRGWTKEQVLEAVQMDFVNASRNTFKHIKPSQETIERLRNDAAEHLVKQWQYIAPELKKIKDKLRQTERAKEAKKYPNERFDA